MPKKKIEETNENMELWLQVCETNPAATERIKMRGGFTAIDSQSQVKRATEIFGMYGVSWGLRDLDINLIYEDNKPVGIYARATFFYNYGDKAGSFDIAADMAYKPNDDCVKKVCTECISKALSRLGFNSDVFEGRFDDSRYVSEMKEKYSNIPEAKIKSTPKIVGSASVSTDMTENIVRKIYDKYMEIATDGKVVNMSKLKAAIVKNFGKLPSKEASISRVMDIITLDDVTEPNDFVKGLE